ncbi:MAG: signal peptidase II [Candidatus Kerfeldbacteria bacterium]|nr:signal peptidase II [Candidatus Kerfeldbacteria bacterium]
MLLLIADRWLKQLALAGRSLTIGPLDFELFANHSLVFSLPFPAAAILTLMVVATMVVAMLVVRSWPRAGWPWFGSMLMLSGATSNLVDRLGHGFVIDWGYLGPWWPVFNLSDVMVVVGLGIYLWPPPLTSR